MWRPRPCTDRARGTRFVVKQVKRLSENVDHQEVSGRRDG